MSENGFSFDLTVYLKDTNLFGNVYFSRYFEWQGMAREAYLQTVPGYEKLLTSGIKLITKKACMDYESECTAFDEIRVIIQSEKIKKYSFNLKFSFVDRTTGQIMARGDQMIGFADSSGNIIMVPEPILDIITKNSIG